MKVVIMAGGKGTRISSVASDIPKPMIKIEGKPVLEHELECLRDQGFTDIIITVSHLGNIIMDYFGDGSGTSPVTGKPFGVHIEYYFEKEPLGNAGALFKIKDKLTSDFLLLNADAVFDVDFNRFVGFHQEHGGMITLFTHPNSHPYDSGLIIADKNGEVEKWLAKEDERLAVGGTLIAVLLGDLVVGVLLCLGGVVNHLEAEPRQIALVDGADGALERGDVGLGQALRDDVEIIGGNVVVPRERLSGKAGEILRRELRGPARLQVIDDGLQHGLVHGAVLSSNRFPTPPLRGLKRRAIDAGVGAGIAFPTPPRGSAALNNAGAEGRRRSCHQLM